MNPLPEARFGIRHPVVCQALVILLGALWLAREWVAMPLQITGKSMVPTFQDGQMALVNKIAYLSTPPQRGDIVAVQTRQELMIKRIVGLPGEEIAIRDGVVYVAGAALNEPYVQLMDFGDVSRGRLGSAKYVVIGDNRSGTAIAVVRENRIVGKVIPLGRRVSRSTSEDLR